MITTLIFVRHGQSEAASKSIVQGRGLLVPLSKEGEKQAKALARALKDFSIDFLFTSTALRATQTAESIRQFHRDTIYAEISELNERSKGEAEGISKEAYAKKYPEIIQQWKQEIDARPPGGENFEDVEGRIVPVLEEHLKRHKGKTLLYAVHGNVMRSFLGYFLQVPFNLRYRIDQDYCAVNIVEYNHDSSRWRIRCINKTF